MISIKHLLLAIPLLASCSIRNTEYQNGGSVNYVFLPQECHYLKITQGIASRSHEDLYQINDFLITKDTEYDRICFGLHITGYPYDSIFNPGFEPLSYSHGADIELEKQILAILPNITGSGDKPMQAMRIIEYRTERCHEVIVRLNGKEITDNVHFIQAESYTSYIFNNDKQLVDHIRTGMSITEYTNFSPLIVPKAHIIIDEIVSTGDRLELEVILENNFTLTDSLVVK